MTRKKDTAAIADVLELPAFLKRGKDNKLPKVKMKGVAVVKRDETPKTSPLDSLSGSARALAEADIASSRARLHWFEDRSTCDHYEALAMRPTPETRSTAARIDKPAKPSKEGLVGIAAIAADLKIIPRIARAALRGAKVPKPAVGWAFAPADVPAIKEKITSWLSKLSPKSTPSKKPLKKSSQASTAATPKKISEKSSKTPGKKSKASSEKSAKTSGSSGRAAKTARASGIKIRGTKPGTKRSSSTAKSKRK